ncbi:MAG: cell division protein SepF [Eggerthellaceae bacterium]|nr:cell division protein SepF [Eggerthellaceae bacterium]
MELPKISLGEGGVLDNIKSKLGFSNDKEEPLDDDDLDDEYDDEDDDDRPNENRFGRAAFQRLRDRVTGDQNRNASQKRSSVRSVSSNLVNIDDVRARTRATDSFADTDRRSSFDRESSFDSSRMSFDPHAAYAGEGETTHAPSRSLSVIRPVAYSEVEQVARCLRAGDMVVLNMKSTPADLAKRILDFSFGAASMVDARVECVGEKVFALSTGIALTDDERARLISQGVL